jgi:hypothetical protein
MELQGAQSVGSGRELFIGWEAISIGSPTCGGPIVSAWNRVVRFTFAMDSAVLHKVSLRGSRARHVVLYDPPGNSNVAVFFRTTNFAKQALLPYVAVEATSDESCKCILLCHYR